jgi:hypothetical protein
MEGMHELFSSKQLLMDKEIVGIPYFRRREAAGRGDPWLRPKGAWIAALRSQ